MWNRVLQSIFGEREEYQRNIIEPDLNIPSEKRHFELTTEIFIKIIGILSTALIFCLILIAVLIGVM